MEAIIFIGIQGSGKSTFYKEKFFNSHVRISMDLLRTRNKEKLFLEACINTSQKLVIDNTNPLKEERKKYIERIRETNYKITGYFFESSVNDCIQRNNQRNGKEKISEKGIFSTFHKLEIPLLEEGFDKIYYVSINENNEFLINGNSANS